MAPNLRDYGMTCDRDFLRIVQSIQSRNPDGWARGSERVFREMYEEDTGHAPGVGTLPKALDRIGADGTLYVIWMQKGGPVSVGYLLIRVAQDRHERRGFRARRERHKGRREVATRVQRDPEALIASLLSAKPTPAAAAPEPHPRLMEARVEGLRAELAALERAWKREAPS